MPAAEPDAQPPRRAAGHPPREIEFVDADYRRWRVVERDARSDPGASAPCCLVFTCRDAVRRVWNYPPNWSHLSAAALAVLSWRR